MQILIITAKQGLVTLSATYLALSLFPKGAIAQQATIGSYGCGTGCNVSVEQLSSPQRMGNGWSRVLVSETTRGSREIPSEQTRRFWQFAKCDDKFVGWGYKSDGSDAKIDNIYYEDGRKIVNNAGGQLYTKWEALCNSPH